MEGKILFVELRGGSFEELNSEKKIREALSEIGRECRVRSLRTVLHRFIPHGITAVSVIAESHIAIHTWPEEGYATILIYTCGKTDPKEALPAIKRMFRHSELVYRDVVSSKGVCV